MSPLVKPSVAREATYLIQPPTVKPLYIAPERIPGPPTVELVIAQGDGAWGYYTGVPLGDWRGFLAPRNHEGGPQVYGVLSFSELSLKRQPHLTLPSKLDWARIPRILNGELPVPFPPG